MTYERVHVKNKRKHQVKKINWITQFIHEIGRNSLHTSNLFDYWAYLQNRNQCVINAVRDEGFFGFFSCAEFLIIFFDDPKFHFAFCTHQLVQFDHKIWIFCFSKLFFLILFVLLCWRLNDDINYLLFHMMLCFH